ncbi:MAG: PKD domain-containing protein [Pseudomonadales bacterium]
MPVADAGPDKRWNGTAPITLDGSGSFDSDGDLLSYSWSLVSSPAGSSATLARADTAFPVVTPDVSGDYVLELVVSDGTNSSTPDQVTVSDMNLKPLADAGVDQAYIVGSTITLDATKSSDPDGDMLSFAWQIVSAPASSASVIAQDTSANAQFTPDVAGDYILGVVVSDGQLDSSLSTVTLRQSGHRPVANAGLDISTTLGQLIQLDGSKSTDIDGDQLTPNWSFTSKPKNSGATLADLHTMHPTFTPDVDGDYVIKLTVYDGSRTSLVDTVTVSSRNFPPVADAGKPLMLQVGQVAHLDGSSSSDPEGTALSYSWSIANAPAGSSAMLTSTSVVAPDFTPDVDGLYTFQLLVSDGSLTSSPSTVVLSSADQPPTANAGSDQSVTSGTQVSLDGSQSIDPEGSVLSYQWDFISLPVGSGAQLSDSANVQPTFTADVAGDFVVQLTVTDANGQTSRDTVVIRDTSKNTMPVAAAGPDLQVDLGKNVVLDGSSSSDADGDTLSYSWALMSRPSGSSAQLNDANTASPNFTPDVEGDFVFQLVVSDGQSVSIPDVVMVHDTERNLAPSASFSFGYNSADPYTGLPITLNGSSSSDPNGDSLSYSWTLIPASGSSSVLSGNGTATPEFTPDIAGRYVVTLLVSDGSLSGFDSSFITVTDQPQGSPIALPSGHNLMFLSTEGGDSNTGALFSVPESNLNNASELLSFHGVPGLAYSAISQGLVVHPTEKTIYTVIDGAGVFGYGAVMKYDPVTDEIETFASIPRQEIAGYVVRDVRTPMIFHPDGKSAYFYANLGGTLNAGVLMHVNTDPTSPDYRQISFIGEIGKSATNYAGSAATFSTTLQWSGTNRLMALFGNGFASSQRPALEFSPSDPTDLSKPWNAEGIGGSIWSAARKFVYDVANDTILTVYSSRPPILDSYGRDGFGGGYTLPSCRVAGTRGSCLGGRRLMCIQFAKLIVPMTLRYYINLIRLEFRVLSFENLVILVK